VNDKPKALKYMYLLSLFFIICNFCSSLFTIERCFYDPCIRGYGRDELNRVHYGLSINSLTFSVFVTAQAYCGWLCFNEPQAPIQLSSPRYAILLGACAVSIIMAMQAFFLWDSYAWMDWNLSKTGNLPPEANGAIFGEDPGGEQLKFVELYPAFRAQAVFSFFLMTLFMAMTVLMLYWGSRQDERLETNRLVKNPQYSTFAQAPTQIPMEELRRGPDDA